MYFREIPAAALMQLLLRYVLLGEEPTALPEFPSRLGPAERGIEIMKHHDLRDCSLSLLLEPPQLPVPAITISAIAEHLGRLVYFAPDSAARESAFEILELDIDDLAQDLVSKYDHWPQFVEQLLAGDFIPALLFCDRLPKSDFVDWGEDKQARLISEQMRALYACLAAQLLAAAGWRMRKAPFDGAFGEDNIAKRTSVGACVNGATKIVEGLKRILKAAVAGRRRIPGRPPKFLSGKASDLSPVQALANLMQVAEAEVPPISTMMIERCDQVLTYIQRYSTGAHRSASVSKKQLHNAVPDYVLAPASMVVLLAVRCAELGKIFADSGNHTARDFAYGISAPPGWIDKSPSRLNNSDKAQFLKFSQIFQLYRGTILQDYHAVIVNDPASIAATSIWSDEMDGMFRSRKWRCIREEMKALQSSYGVFSAESGRLQGDGEIDIFLRSEFASWSTNGRPTHQRHRLDVRY